MSRLSTPCLKLQAAPHCYWWGSSFCILLTQTHPTTCSSVIKNSQKQHCPTGCGQTKSHIPSDPTAMDREKTFPFPLTRSWCQLSSSSHHHKSSSTSQLFFHCWFHPDPIEANATSPISQDLSSSRWQGTPVFRCRFEVESLILMKNSHLQIW